MFKIKELFYKTNLTRILALQFSPNVCKHIRYKWTGKIKDDECRRRENNSTERVNHCMLMAYAGNKYIGMQYQKDTNIPTIEGIFFKALLDNNWINKTEYYQPKRIKYQHGSRTDKGVSAARQCCSILLPEGLNVQIINNNLPEDIRIFGLKRVTDSFNSRRYCTERTYSYTLPTIAFSHYNDQISQKTYRISSDKLKLVNDLLQVYKGQKNFHNFTIDKKFEDQFCVRKMNYIECGSPFLVNDVEFCVIRIRGRSFMMYQIRKMMGLILAVAREVIDSTIFEHVFTESLINCPTAPSLGLVLHQQHYDEYDRHYGNSGLYEKLTWEEYDDKVQQFFERYIQSTIVETEIEKLSMMEWLESLLNYTYVPETVNDIALRNEDKSVYLK